MKKITAIGGGTGTYVVLSGLKAHPLDLSAVVTMMDSGGSTGRLRDQLGVLPPGDLRQCLVALSDAPDLWRKLFLYRFENGDLEGHNFGNIFISALEKIGVDYDTVIAMASYVLDIKGTVLPVTYQKTHLQVWYENGTKIVGEGNIDENNPEKSRIVRAELVPKVQASTKAVTRLIDSDFIIMGPGDLYTSMVPIFLVDGIKEAVIRSKAKIIYIANLMTKAGQTSGYKAGDFLKDIKKYVGRDPDFVIMHKGQIPESIITWYRDHDEMVVENNIDKESYIGRLVEADLINRNHIAKSASDKLTRSILRHDSEKLTNLLLELIYD